MIPPQRLQAGEDGGLARIEQRIVEGEGRIARLSALVGQLALRGADTTPAEELLRTFEDVLSGWNRQREAMLRACETEPCLPSDERMHR